MSASLEPRDANLSQAPPPPPSRLTVQDVACSGQRVLRLVGELDIASVEMVESALQNIFASRSHSEVVLDLGGVTFMDSNGVRMVLIASALCAKDGVEFRVLAGCPQVQRLFEVTGLDDVLSGTSP